MTLHAVIMAGGSGTRFWPASRRARPKQFLPLCRGRSLLQGTVDRVRGLAGTERTWIVTNAEQAASLHQVLDDFPEDDVIVEPEPRDTAPCAALAAVMIEAREPGATMVFMPADHLIEPTDTFHQLLRRAAALTEAGEGLVIFGVQPTAAVTGFGYIEPGDTVDAASPAAHLVASFREKPDRATAAALVASGALWNSGIFVWTYAALIQAMEVAEPTLFQCTAAMLECAKAGDTPGVHKQFLKAPKTSVDFAVMERAPRVVVVQAELSWSDLGSFLALDGVGETALADSVADSVAFTAAGAQTFLHDSAGCVVYGEGKRTISLFGAHDLVVVAVDDAVLVCPKDRAGDLKELVEALRAAGRHDLL
ncbi:MAG: mannose-1-phosphate guanylyltransferase [Planctomycetota bacterium]|jgi:mannose-1-phosphate guanylyltransferase